MCRSSIILFFFFQAEDGIRDKLVTGVQTCALPISLGMRWAIVAAAVLVMLAAWPLYQNSRRELAPVEDQSHISLFMQASPDASLEATNRASLQVVKAVTAFPGAKFMWSLTASWGRFGGMGAK